MTTLRLPPLPTPRDLVKLYRVRAMKQLSQNFLMDMRLSDKIVKMAGKLQDGHVVEVGPGPGGLTQAIIRRQPKKLIVVEKDSRFTPTLQLLAETFASVNGQMDIVLDDIMKINMSNIFPEEEKREWNDKCPNIHLIGNLPFSVSTPLIVRWLQDISEHGGAWSMGRTPMTLTFQKEVAERLVAEASGEQRCRLSVMAQAWTKPILKFVIPGKAFVPKPDVDVGVVKFIPLITPRTKHDFKLFEKITRHMFSFRQKHSINCARTLFPVHCQNELAMIMFKLVDLDPTIKPYELTVEDMSRLCTAYKYILKNHPEINSYNFRASRKLLPPSQTINVRIQSYF